jgi:hypothetical protein
MKDGIPWNHSQKFNPTTTTTIIIIIIIIVSLNNMHTAILRQQFTVFVLIVLRIIVPPHCRAKVVKSKDKFHWMFLICIKLHFSLQ